MEKVRLMALGGLDEDGKNMYCVEIDDDIFVVDAGLKYPENQQLGVEYVIPDFDYSGSRSAYLLPNNQEYFLGRFACQNHLSSILTACCRYQLIQRSARNLRDPNQIIQTRNPFPALPQGKRLRIRKTNDVHEFFLCIAACLKSLPDIATCLLPINLNIVNWIFLHISSPPC